MTTNDGKPTVVVGWAGKRWAGHPTRSCGHVDDVVTGKDTVCGWGSVAPPAQAELGRTQGGGVWEASGAEVSQVPKSEAPGAPNICGWAQLFSPGTWATRPPRGRRGPGHVEHEKNTFFS